MRQVVIVVRLTIHDEPDFLPSRNIDFNLLRLITASHDVTRKALFLGGSTLGCCSQMLDHTLNPCRTPYPLRDTETQNQNKKLYLIHNYSPPHSLNAYTINETRLGRYTDFGQCLKLVFIVSRLLAQFRLLHTRLEARQSAVLFAELSNPTAELGLRAVELGQLRQLLQHTNCDIIALRLLGVDLYYDLPPDILLDYSKVSHLGLVLFARLLRPALFVLRLERFGSLHQLVKGNTHFRCGRKRRHQGEQPPLEFGSGGRIALREPAQKPVALIARKLSSQGPEIRLRRFRQRGTVFGSSLDEIRRNVELLHKALEGRGELLQSCWNRRL